MFTDASATLQENLSTTRSLAYEKSLLAESFEASMKYKENKKCKLFNEGGRMKKALEALRTVGQHHSHQHHDKTSSSIITNNRRTNTNTTTY